MTNYEWDFRLIDLVHKSPIIWQGLKNKKRISSENEWQIIADSLKSNVIFCKNKYNRLKERYRQQLKRISMGKNLFPKHQYLLEAFKFLESEIKSR